MWQNRQIEGVTFYRFSSGGESFVQKVAPPSTVSEVAKTYDAIATSKPARVKPEIVSVRKHHNEIVSSMISRAVSIVKRETRGIRVLDVAGGKGGALTKWHDCTVDQYIHMDISAQSCLCAQRRFKTLARQNKALHSKTKFSTMCVDLTETWPVPKGATFDIITCHFALNYFAQTPKRLQQLLRCLRSALRPGGVLSLTWTSSPCPSSGTLFSVVPVTDRSYTFTLDGSVGSALEYVVTDPLLLCDGARLHVSFFLSSLRANKKQSKPEAELSSLYSAALLVAH